MARSHWAASELSSCWISFCFEPEKLLDFHENFLYFREELSPVAHFIDMVDVLLRFFREKRKVQEPEKINARQFILFARMHLVLDDSGRIVFHTVAVEVVALLLYFDQHALASVSRTDNIDNAVFLAEYAGKFLHFERDILDRIAIV